MKQEEEEMEDEQLGPENNPGIIHLGGEPNVVAIVIAGVAIAAALRYAALYFGVF